MENLISTCFVIVSNDVGVEPIIYLNCPIHNPNEKLYCFDSPFIAKKFIQDNLGPDTKVRATKEIFSQLHLGVI